MKTKAILLSITASALFALSCNAQNSNNRQRNQEPPSVDEIFKDFTKIDTDEDGFLSKEEVEKAPKPKGRR